MSSEKKNERLGALWVKDGAKGKFFSGVLEIPQEVIENAAEGRNGEVKIPVVVFRVNEKRNDKGPDWDILLGRDAGGGQQRQAPKADPITDDDIPF